MYNSLPPIFKCMLTVKDINKIEDPIERRKLKIQIIERHNRKELKQVRTNFLSFVKKMWPDFIEGSHHQTIADKFNRLATGELTRLIINMPPRHTKSEFASFFLPAFMIGQNPKLKICLLYTSPSPRDRQKSRMPSSA